MVNWLCRLIILGLFSFSALAQNPNLDSLNAKLSISQEDTNKVLILSSLSDIYVSFAPEKAKKYAQQGFILSQKLGFRRGEMLVLNRIGRYHYFQGDFAQSIKSATQSLKIAEKLKDTLGIADNYRLLGLVYNYDLKEYDLAIQYTWKALELYKQKNNSELIGSTYSNLAWIYATTNQKLVIAHQYANLAIKIAQKYHQKAHLADYLNTKGLIYQKENKLDSALIYLHQSTQIAEKANDKVLNAYNYVEIAHIYWQQNKYSEALAFYRQVIPVSRELKLRHYLNAAYLGLVKIYKLQKQYDSVYQYQYLATQLKDSLLNWETAQRTALLRTGYEEDTQKAKIALLEKQKRLMREEENLYLLAYLGSFLSALFIIFLVLRNNRQRSKANQILKEKNEEIAQQAEELQLGNEEVISQRDSLDEKVKQRTQTLELAHEKLRDYAFANDYKVKNLVSTVISLTTLLNAKNINEVASMSILKNLQNVAEELDAVTHEINQNLEDFDYDNTPDFS